MNLLEVKSNYYMSICLILFLFSIILAQSNYKELEGNKPYTPTRLEWLAVDLNSIYRSTFFEGKIY